MEIWWAIPGYEGFYEASSYGKVRSVTRKVAYGKNGYATYRGRELKLFMNKNGYRAVKLAIKGQCRTTYVHGLILKAFVGARPITTERGEIRHLDGDKTNNRLENLVYGTINENAADRVRHRSSK